MLALPIQTHTNHWPFHQINFVPSSQPQLGDPAGMHLWTVPIPQIMDSHCQVVTLATVSHQKRLLEKKWFVAGEQHLLLRICLPFIRLSETIFHFSGMPSFEAGSTPRWRYRLWPSPRNLHPGGRWNERGKWCWIEILTHGTVDGRNPIKPS